MRVAIEAASLSLTSGGLARYTSQLSMALARCFAEDEFFLISDQAFRMPSPAPANLKSGGGPRNAMERRWWLYGLAREMGRLGAELVHGPDFAVPYLLRRPSVLTLHDLSPWMDERWHHAAQRVRRRTPVLFELGLATMVITPGEKVRRAAIERFGLRPERVVAVPEAAAHWFRPVETSPAHAVLPLRRNARAAQESRGAAGSLARSAAPSCGGPGARRAPPRRRSRNSSGARLAPGRRGGGFRTAGAVFGRARLCLPIALRRLRTAGAGSHAVRRAGDRLACRRRSGGRCRDLRRYAARNGKARWRTSRRCPNSPPPRASFPSPAPANSPGNGPPG